MLAALTIHLFHVEKFFVAFLRVSQRAFWPKRFLCELAFFFSYSEDYFFVVYPSFYFILGRDPSGRDKLARLCFTPRQGFTLWFTLPPLCAGRPT